MRAVESGHGPSGRRFGVRRAAVPARTPAILELPLPGYCDGAEAAWRQTALDAILSSRVRPFAGAVEVSLTFREGRRARVMGDLPNACLQLLIGSRLIASADSPVLRRLTLSWGTVEGIRMEIRAAEGPA